MTTWDTRFILVSLSFFNKLMGVFIMASTKENGQVFAEIGDILGIVKESGTTDWSKVVAYFNWLSEKKKGDKCTLDIRNYNFGTKQIGKGISLSTEEADRLTNILLENDFGSISELEKALEKKRNFFCVKDEIDSALLDEDDGMYHIEINR